MKLKEITDSFKIKRSLGIISVNVIDCRQKNPYQRLQITPLHLVSDGLVIDY